MAFNSLFSSFILTISLFLCAQVGYGQEYNYETAKFAQVFTQSELQKAKTVIHNAVNFALHHETVYSNTSSNTSKCIKALNNSAGNLFSYFDADGKLPAGVARGNLAWLGSFESCQDLSNSHYCLLSINIQINLPQFQNKTLSLQWGLCLPSACGADDLQNIFANLSKKLSHSKEASFQFEGASCPARPKYTTDVIITLALCGFLLLLCVLGTIIDVFECNSCGSRLKRTRESSYINHVQRSSIQDEEVPFQTTLQPYLKSTADLSAPLVSSELEGRRKALISKNLGFCVEFLRCFSLLRNTSKIFNTSVPPKVISSVNGIRVVSMFWIILGHTFLFMLMSSLMANPVDMVKDTRNVSMMVVTNGFFSVDTFFFISGLLVAYTCFRKLEKNEGKFNWFLFYFHRYFRLTPSLMFVILFYVKLKPFLTFSPLWTSIHDDHCQKYWWTNLLYINNFYPTAFGDECVGWTWYLANDMQFFIISPLILILAYRFGWLGLLASTGPLFISSTVILAAIYGHYDIDPTALSKYDTEDNPFDTTKGDYANFIYGKPYCRIQPYLIGMVLGYFIYKSYSGTRKPGWVAAIIAWLSAIALGITLVYAPYDNVQKNNRHWSKAEKVFYGMFSRAAWGVALAWVVYACHYGFGGLVQKFLSARFWIPLSRLTYSAYLVHPIVLSYIFSGSQTTLYYTYSTVTYNFIAGVVLSYSCAFILSVIIEFPCDNLENLAVDSLRKRKRGN